MDMEKWEECPSCGEHGEGWLYDFQGCKACGYLRLVEEKKHFNAVVACKEIDLRERDNRIHKLVKSRNEWKESSARWFGKATDRLTEIDRLKGIMANDISSALDDCVELEMTAIEMRDTVKGIISKILSA